VVCAMRLPQSIEGCGQARLGDSRFGCNCRTHAAPCERAGLSARGPRRVRELPFVGANFCATLGSDDGVGIGDGAELLEDLRNARVIEKDERVSRVEAQKYDVFDQSRSNVHVTSMTFCSRPRPFDTPLMRRPA